MKNILLLPTDKPSRLVLNSINNDLFLTTTEKFPSDIMKFKNIYIISDEEIKEGDWYWLEKIDKIGTKSGAYKSGNAKVSRLNTLASNCKKIILTTDKDLINDGVQAIDDEFLEWFVKNPSCEWVEISLEETQYGSGIYEYVIYKREIPKEEPKQRLEKYSERFNNKENEVVDGIFNPENWGRRVVKQETLEEAAETELYRNINKIIDGGKDLPKGVNVSRGHAVDYAFEIALKVCKWLQYTGKRSWIN